MRYEEVPLRAIDFRDDRFRMSRDTGQAEFIRAIRQTGLISPPVVIKKGSRYTLVTGWKRALACRSLGFRKIAVLITVEKSPWRLLFLAVSENLATRELSLVEKATILFKLEQSGLARTTLVKEYLPRLALPATSDELRMMLSLARSDRVFQDFVSEKTSPPAVVKALLRFPPGDIRPLLPLLRALGQNKQRQALEDLWDIVRRDRLSVRRLLRRKGFQQILLSSRLSIPQKAEGIRQRLRKLRYPGLSANEEAFRSTLREVRWPRDISVQHSPFFEENDLTVSFRVRSRKELKAILERLGKAASREEIDQLFRKNE